jgi:hypothetical protein
MSTMSVREAQAALPETLDRVHRPVDEALAELGTALGALHGSRTAALCTSRPRCQPFIRNDSSQFTTNIAEG